MKQIDIFGNEHDPPPLPSRKTKTMQEMFGCYGIPFVKCKHCAHCHCYKNYYGGRRWYKCELWDRYFRGSSAASDIRINADACAKFVEKGIAGLADEIINKMMKEIEQ